MQFAVGSLLAVSMWTLNLHEKPKVDKDLVRIFHSSYKSIIFSVSHQMPCCLLGPALDCTSTCMFLHC